MWEKILCQKRAKLSRLPHKRFTGGSKSKLLLLFLSGLICFGPSSFISSRGSDGMVWCGLLNRNYLGEGHVRINGECFEDQGEARGDETEAT